MRRITLISIVVAMTGALGACTDAGRSLIILQNQIPDSNCVIPSSASSTFRGIGYLDVNSPSGYLFTPLVQNVADGINGDPSARLVLIQGADVELEFQTGFNPPADDTAITQLTSGSIKPDGGLVGLAFNAVTAKATQQIKASDQLAGGAITTIVAHVTVFGEMDGGTVESRQFDYPIQACDGCLVRNVGACDSLATDYQAEQGFQCYGYFQDALIDCCTDTNGGEVCPAVSTML